MSDARETYPKLNANTFGPRHQGETSCQAQAALNEIDDLRRWKAEAVMVLAEWERVWVLAGSPGRLGESKAVAVARLFAPEAFHRWLTSDDQEDDR